MRRVRWALASCGAALVGCQLVLGIGSGDLEPAGIADDASVEAAADVQSPDAARDVAARDVEAATPPPCDLDGGWDVHEVPELKAPPSNVYSVTLTADELRIYLTSDRDGGQRLYVADRASLGTAFGPVQLEARLNPPTGLAADPSLSADGKTMYFAASNAGTQGYDLFVATRASPTGPWDQGRTLLAILSTAADDSQVSANDRELFYTSNAGGADMLYRATKLMDGGFEARTAVPGIDASTPTSNPAISSDGLTLFFSRRKTAGAPKDLWKATRASATAAFGPAVAVTELNTGVDEQPSWVSHDGCRLYFTRNAVGPFDVYRADRAR
jgi:hypothetical protein